VRVARREMGYRRVTALCKPEKMPFYESCGFVYDSAFHRSKDDDKAAAAEAAVEVAAAVAAKKNQKRKNKNNNNNKINGEQGSDGGGTADTAARQLWMGSVPPEYTAEFIKCAFADHDVDDDDDDIDDDEDGVPRAVVIRRNAFRTGGESVGFAMVTFRSAEEAARAHARLDGTPIPNGTAGAAGGAVFFLRRFAETLRTAVPDAADAAADPSEVTLASQLAPLATSVGLYNLNPVDP
jgi:hypothetical protein